MPPCLEDLHGYTVVVVKGGQNRYFHSLYLRKQAKTTELVEEGGKIFSRKYR